jgi:pimeloyl-ACP methyl ester carboxylesterase
MNMKQKEVYMDSYERSLELWPIRYISRFIETSYGKTHIIECGNKTGENLVLLHGANMSSTMWYPNIIDLAVNYRIFCIDILGDKNKSVVEKEFQNRKDYAEWLKEVFVSLDIKKADIIGLSYGALNTINYLLYYPKTVRKVAIMSPAATYISFDPQFYSYAFGMVNNKEGVVKFLNWIFNGRYTVHPYIVDQLSSAMMWNDPSKSTVPKENGFPYVFTDTELASIDNPILLLLGDKEVLYDPKAALNRALKSSPNIEVEMVEEVGHLMSMEKPEYINKRILQFLSE